jgi:hypothetical protein
VQRAERQISMNVTMKTPEAWRAALGELGFRRTRDGSRFRHNGLAVTPQRRWLVASARGGKGEDPLCGQLGKPGLWKPVTGGTKSRREFHLPLAVLSVEEVLGEGEEDAPDPLEVCLGWASATALDDLPAGWECPAREEIESWIPEGGLTVRSDDLVRQGSLVCGPDRLALRMPIVHEVHAGLSEARRAWLRELLLDAQDRWYMVRIGFVGEADRPAIAAEVDLSGAPRVVLEAVFRIGLDALRWVVLWLVRSAGLVADARVGCRICETGPERE